MGYFIMPDKYKINTTESMPTAYLRPTNDLSTGQTNNRTPTNLTNKTPTKITATIGAMTAINRHF